MAGNLGAGNSEKDGSLFRIPRLYWTQRRATSLHANEQEGFHERKNLNYLNSDCFFFI